MTREVAALVAKGRRSLTAATRLFREGDYDFAASRAYYAMFYVASAALLARGITASTHSGVLTMFWEHLVKPNLVARSYHQALHRAFDTRTVGDYGIQETVTKAVAAAQLRDARRFVRKLEQVVRTARRAA